MQPGNQPEDIQTILSRFHTWAEKRPGDGNGASAAPGPEAVREIPYEEAMRNFRQRHPAQRRRVPAPAAAPVPIAQAAAPVPPHPEEAVPALTERAPLPDAAQSTKPEGGAQSAPVAERPPIAKAIPAVPSAEKRVTKKKAAAPPQRARIQPPPTAAPTAALPVPPQRVEPAQTKPPSRSRPEPRPGTSAKKEAAPAVRSRRAQPKKPVFKKVLASTVKKAQRSAPAAPRPASNASKAAPARDRNQRITTRFSSAEQRKLERAAAQAGLTVSAWLRQCALRAEAAAPPQAAPPPSAKTARTARPAPSPEPTLFSYPAPSGLGNWLTLLRQRFLSSPARFSERA